MEPHLTSSVSPALAPRPDIGRLAEPFVTGFPKMNPEAQRLASTLYRLLAAGLPVSHEQLATALDRPRERVDQTLAQWPGVFHDDAGRVIGFWGLALAPMTHKLTLGAKTLYAWCAWDTLFLPALLDATLGVESRCAESGASIRLTVSPAGIHNVEPAATAVSFLDPDVQKLRENMTAHFCHFVHFFRSGAEAQRWCDRHPATFVLTLEQAFALGAEVNAARYPDIR